MSEKEYFLILPLLLYSIAIAELVSSWRTLFITEKRHIPYITTSFLLLEVAFWNFYRMFHLMTDNYFSSYLSYLPVLLPPLTFLFVVAVFTPDAGTVDIKGYFQKKMPVIFGGMVVFTSLHFFFEGSAQLIPRLIAIALLLVMAIWRKEWIIYLLLLLRITSWFLPG